MQWGADGETRQMHTRERALIVDGRTAAVENLLAVCRRIGIVGAALPSWPEAKEELRTRYHDLVILCLDPRGRPGTEMIREIREMGLDSCIIITAPPRRFRTIVSCLHEGAYDTILSPIRNEWAEIVLRRAIERRRYYAGARMKDHYRRLSIFDELTRIHNHRHFHQTLTRAISAATRYGYPFSVLLMDLDNFKAYNDLHGHLAGDEALRTMGALLAKSIRAGDIAARYGGEEFGLILSHTNKAGACMLAERLRAGAEALHRGRGGRRMPAPLTISIGVASFPDDGRTKDALLTKADKALYLAKRSGKNRVCG